MPAVMTRADSLREYLTGAASDGGAQADPNLSLGGFRSSTEAASMGIVVTGGIANITVDFAGGGNNVGAGSLECVDSNTLRWKDAGGVYGPAVAIATGELKLLEADGDPGAFIRVTRTSATALVPGTATVTLSILTNNQFGYDDVTSAEASAGDTEYRGTYVKNVSAASVTSFKRWIGLIGTTRTSDGGQLPASGAGSITTTGSFADWPDSGFCHIKTNVPATRELVYYSSRTGTVLTVPAAGRALQGTSAAAGAATDTLESVPGIAIAKDADGVEAAGSSVPTVANENTAPSGVTWNIQTTAALGLSIGTMLTGEQIVIWTRRVIPAGAISAPAHQNIIQNSFDSTL